MLMRRKLLSAARRFAAGIDVSPREVRLVIVSRKRRGNRPVRIEWVGTAPLAAGVMSGAHLVDRAAIVAALSSLCERWPRRHAMHGMPCFMAVPGAATAVSLSPIASTERLFDRGGASPPAIDGLEPSPFGRFDRPNGMESPGARAARRRLEERVEAAAAARIALAAVDGEPQVALRAITYAAEHAGRPPGRYAVIWAGYDGVYGWRIADRDVETASRFPGGEHADLESALRLLAGTEGLEAVFVGGDIRLLERIGLTVADIGERLGCGAAPFECASFCCRAGVLAEVKGWKHGATYAVAFGLALRGVTQ